MTVAWLVVFLVLTAAVVGFALRRTDLRGAAAVLRLLAVLFAAVAAAVLVRPVWEDSGTFAIWSLGLPVAVALVPLLAAGTRWAVVVTAAAAALLLAWSVLLALGVGLFLLPAALAETAAVVVDRPATRAT